MKNDIGFTLVEVLVCAAIVCIVAGLASPAIGSFKARMALHEAVSDLVSGLHMARSVAIKRNDRVVLSYSEKGYKIFIDSGSGGGIREDWIQQPGEQTLVNATLDDRLEILMDESTFSLHRARFSRSPGIKPGAIVIKGDCGKKKRVIINSVGRIRIE